MMRGLGNIDIQVLDGTNVAATTYNRQMANNMALRAMQLNSAKRNAVKYHTGGLDNQTYKNIDAVVNGLDFIGYVGNGSIEDSEMLRAHIVRTKAVVDKAPQAVAAYQNPRQLSGMLGYVIDNWDSANREAAIDNMAREESRLILAGAINIGKDSGDAHYLTDNEIYDADRQNVLPNGMVETKMGYRGLFNRIKLAGTNANVLSKDAEIANDHSFTRKAVDTLRDAVRIARTDRPKLIAKKTRNRNGEVHVKYIKLPQQTATTEGTARVLRRRGEAERKLADQIQAQHGQMNGLGDIESDSLTDILQGTDFAFNGCDGLSKRDNIENYRLYFRRLSDAIEANPLLYYNTQAEADAVRHILDEAQWAIGSDAAMEELIAKYSGLSGFEGLGKLKILKKAAKAVKKTAKAVANTTAKAVKNVAQSTANVAKSAANATKTVAKAAVNTTASAVKSAVNTTKAAANVVKAGAQAATGNKDKAKETLKKAASQAKAAVVEPAKTAIKTTVSVAKNAVIKPVATVVKETVVKPTVAAAKATIKITKKVTKAVGKVAKKVIKAILLYNPITLLIKAGLLIAFRLNMFKMSMRAYAGSFNETQWAAFAQKNGIELSEYDKFKKAYDKIHHICCDILGMKESKVLAALEKGSNRKWSGLDAADCTEGNEAAFAQAAKDEGKAADKNAELQNDINEVAADYNAEESELQKQAAANNQELRADTSLPEGEPTKAITEEREITVDTITNARTIKADTPLYETADDKGKQVATLKKGDTVYVDEAQGDDKFVAAATIDGKQGFVAKAQLSTIADGEGAAVSGICGLIDNGYEPIGGLGEAVTAATATTAASGTIASICVAIGKAFNGGINFINKAADVAETYNDIKQTFSNNDEIEETPEAVYEPQQPQYAPVQAVISTQQSTQPQYVTNVTTQPQQYTTPTAPAKKSNTGLWIGIGAVATAAIAGFFIFKD